MVASRDLPVLHPEVHFAPDFVQRLERFVARSRRGRDASEGERRAAWASGAGAEFAGYRPYRAGEDLRRLDWNLLARLDRPYVRVQRAEAGGDWLVLLDTSASMAVGPPGKLQRAAEVAAALCALGARLGARVGIADGGAERPREFASPFAAHSGSLGDVLGFLGGLRADGGDERFARALARVPARVEHVFVVGDLWTQEPGVDGGDENAGGVLALARRGRKLTLIRVLAPIELEPPELGPVEWIDPESGARLALLVDAQARTRYTRELEGRLERWRAACAARGVGCGAFSSALAFEDILVNRHWQP